MSWVDELKLRVAGKKPLIARNDPPEEPDGPTLVRPALPDPVPVGDARVDGGVPAAGPVAAVAVPFLGSWGNASIDQHDALFVAASDAVQRKKGIRVSPRFMKAVMGVESGENGNYPISQCRPYDGYPGPLSCGPMQIKWAYHTKRCPECSVSTVAGHIELATHIIGDTMKQYRCDEYEAYIRGYLTSDDINGTTQQEAVAGLKQRVRKMEASVGQGTTPAPTPEPAPITYGNLVHPLFEDRPITKGQGNGWDDLGKRNPKGVVLHRMVGTLRGTDSYFRQAGTAALTDYGVGVGGVDSAADDGKLIRWNDPLGRRSGWASGPVSKPYGDGAAFVNKYGASAVNRDLVSIEISGQYLSTLSSKAFETIAQLMAYWADQMRIPWHQYPINPATGISAVLWHQEFTIGTGKVCPGSVVMDQTPALIQRAKAILKLAQTGDATAPMPQPTYAPVKPLSGPAWDGTDRTINGSTYYAIARRYKATKPGKVQQYAELTAAEVRAPLTVGESVDGQYLVSSGGIQWVVTKSGARILATDLAPKVTVEATK